MAGCASDRAKLQSRGILATGPGRCRQELPLEFLLCCTGDGGFFIISANQTVFQADFFVLGSLFSQCTVTMFADKTMQPTYSPNCALGQPNACCNADGGNACYKRK